MNKLIISTALFLIVAGTTTVQAKDKHKKKHHHHDSDKKKYSEYQRRHYSNSNNYRQYSQDYRYGQYSQSNSYRYSDSNRGSSRVIYVIEGDRPVQRTVYLDSNGRYYRQYDGRRQYVSQHYFESYPSRYYTSSGQRRINISLPF